VPGSLRLVLALAAAALLAFVAAGVARADGDPASDVLPTQDVYLPVVAPSTEAAGSLAKSVAQVFAGGNRLKVAVIGTLDDMGSVPVLFNQTQEYARFLGVELSGFYVGPLLIVMPAGFGFYDGGRPIAAATAVLGNLSVNRSSPDTLVHSAVTAVDRLRAAGSLVSPDVKAPTPYTGVVAVRPGKVAKLTFRLFDDSERSSATVTVVAGTRTLARLAVPMRPALYSKVVALDWRAPKTITAAVRKKLKLCVVAVDPAGNRSAPNCVKMRVR
jgi:hypothetical protein